MQRSNRQGANWFLAYFRDQAELERRTPLEILERSFNRANALNRTIVEVDERLIDRFEVYRPDGAHDSIGVAMLKALCPHA